MDDDDTIPSNAVETAIAGVKSEALRDQLRAEGDPSKALAMAQEIRATQGVVSWHMAFIIGGFILALVGILAIIPTETVLTDAAASRPILMLIVILTTSVFGGALINGAIFKSVDKDKFANGREIFLFFSGISATVIGFYFGSATTEDARSDAPTVSAAIEENGVLAFRLIGGQAPSTVRLISNAKSLAMKVDPADTHRFTVAANTDLCPANGSFEVSGGFGGQVKKSFPISLSREELAMNKWTACSDDESASPEGQGGEDSGEAEAAVN